VTISSSPLSVGAIAGIVIGSLIGVAFLVGIGIGIGLLYRRPPKRVRVFTMASLANHDSGDDGNK
jgi:hypothetical protein